MTVRFEFDGSDESIARSRVIYEALFVGGNTGNRTLKQSRALCRLLDTFETISVPTVDNLPDGTKMREIIDTKTLSLSGTEYTLLLGYLDALACHARAAAVGLCLRTHDWVAGSRSIAED